MKLSKLLYLVILAGALLALATWTSKRHHAAPPSGIGRALLPQLDLETVARLEITHTGAPLIIARGDDGWRVESLFGFPADVAKLRDNLLKIKELKIGDVARGMNIDTNATLVDIQSSAGKPLATLRLGKRYEHASSGGAYGGNAGGRYLSVAGDPKVYLVKESLDDFDGDGKVWVDTQLLNVPSTDIQTIELAAPTGTVVTLSRATGALQLQGLATNEEFDASKAYGVESAFSYLSFSGVADPKLDDAKMGLTAPSTYRVRLKNGDLYTAQIGQAVTNVTDRYLRLTAELAPPGTNATQKVEFEKRKTDLDRKFSHWTYLVSAYTADNMTRTRADLVKPKVTTTNAVETATDAIAPKP